MIRFSLGFLIVLSASGIQDIPTGLLVGLIGGGLLFWSLPTINKKYGDSCY